MNGSFSIELAHQHRQDLLDYASQSRIAARTPRTRRPPLAARFADWRQARTRSRTTPLRRAATVGGCAAH